MMKNLLAFLLTLFVAAPSALAQEAPDAMVKNVTEEVLSIVRKDKDIQDGNTQKVIELIEAKVLPYFDFQRMTALAVGRNWRNASEEQKQKLAEEFKTLLMRTYSNALISYKDQTIRYKPFKMKEGETDALVRTEILQPGSKPIELEYSLTQEANGWKVYDVVVAGVSLVTNYRETFSQEVRANGIDSLIKMLADKNKQLDPATK